MNRIAPWIVVVAGLVLPGFLHAQQVTKEAVKAEEKLRAPDVIYVPTPDEVVQKMLELAEVKKDDLVYDLGCGDGRIVVAAAKKFGCRAVGFDIDPERIKEARENVKKNGVESLVTIEHKDIFSTSARRTSSRSTCCPNSM